MEINSVGVVFTTRKKHWKYGILLIRIQVNLCLYNRESEDRMLALKETIKTISKDKKVTQLEMAEMLGISKQNFSNKMQRNTFSPDELAKIADKLGMELAFIDKDAEIKGGKYIIESNAE